MKRGQAGLPKIFISVAFAIIGFIVVLFFITNGFDIGNYSEDEICKLSVLTRATAPSVAERLLPLKCTTKKLCLTKTGEDCEQFIGESNVQKVKLPRNTKDATRKIEEISANAMFDCWSNLGEGKLDLFGGKKGSDITTDFLAEKFTAGEIKPKCVICSRIAIAKDLYEEENLPIIENVDLSRYIKETQVPGSTLTYLQTFTDRQVSAYPLEFKNNFNKKGNTTDQIAFVFMQILADGRDPLEIAIDKGSATGIAVAGGILLNPFGKVFSFATLKLTVVATILSAATSGGLAYIQSGKNQELATIHCEKFTSASSDQYGCSIVTPVDYNDINKLNLLCNGGIEGSL